MEDFRGGDFRASEGVAEHVIRAVGYRVLSEPITACAFVTIVQRSLVKQSPEIHRRISFATRSVRKSALVWQELRLLIGYGIDRA